jgi:hypothetical protein
MEEYAEGKPTRITFPCAQRSFSSPLKGVTFFPTSLRAKSSLGRQVRRAALSLEEQAALIIRQEGVACRGSLPRV